MNIYDVVDWIKKNRTGYAFKDYSDDLIISQICGSIRNDIFRISVDENKNIIGIVCGERNDTTKIIFINDILTTRFGVVKQFLSECVEKYPDYELHGCVHGERKRIFKSSKRLLSKL